MNDIFHLNACYVMTSHTFDVRIKLKIEISTVRTYFAHGSKSKIAQYLVGPCGARSKKGKVGKVGKIPLFRFMGRKRGKFPFFVFRKRGNFPFFDLLFEKGENSPFSNITSNIIKRENHHSCRVGLYYFNNNISLERPKMIAM